MMNVKRVVGAALALALAGALAWAQNSARATPGAASRSRAATKPRQGGAKPATASSQKAPALHGVIPSGPEEAAHKAAEDLARKIASGTASQTNTKPGDRAPNVDQKGLESKSSASSGQAPADAIGEFQPAPAEADPTGPSPRLSRHHKAALSRVHGEVYGSGGGAGREAGGAVGATSKSGKTSVYVESDQSRDVASPPH